MTQAEKTVIEAAARIPAEVGARFETAKELSDEDRQTITELARQTLGPFQPKPEAKPDEPDQKAGKQPEPKAKAGNNSEPKPDAQTESTAAEAETKEKS
jgi:F-type H+-transporting ATPase subunit alpha